MDDPNKPPEDKTEFVRIADEETKHLKDLIDESLEMARLDTAKSVVGSLVKLLASQLGSNGEVSRCRSGSTGTSKTGAGSLASREPS